MKIKFERIPWYDFSKISATDVAILECVDSLRVYAMQKTNLNSDFPLLFTSDDNDCIFYVV